MSKKKKMKRKGTNPFSPHLKQTHKSVRHWLCHWLVTFRARPCERPLSVPVTKPSVSGDLGDRRGCLSQKHCQIKSPCFAHSKRSRVLLILYQSQKCWSPKAAVFHTSLRILWLYIGCLCMVIKQVWFPWQAGEISGITEEAKAGRK